MNSNDIEFYGQYAPYLEEAENWLVDRLNKILDENCDDPEFSMTEHLLYRLKSSESLRQKMQKNGLNPDVDTALKEMHDIIGVRLVVHFIGDVYQLLEAIQASDCWQVSEVKDYIKNPKPNGYRSLHLILSIPFGGPGFEHIFVEIQMRTIAMDCWAALEHQLNYKKNIPNAPLIQKELGRCAAEMASTDLTLQTIREMISRGND